MFKAGIIFALGTLICRIFGLLREISIAYIFGTSENADVMNVALRLPNFFRRIFAEGALSSAIIPFYSEKYKESPSLANAFIFKVSVHVSAIVLLLILIMEIFMEDVIKIIAPGILENSEIIYLCRITMPYLFLICIASIFGSLLFSRGKFALYAFIPSLSSIAIVIGCYISGNSDVIAYLFLLSGIVQIIAMYYGAYKMNLVPKITLNIGISEDIKIFFSKFLSIFLSLGASHINALVMQAIASLIPGAIAAIAYADRIYQFPLSMIGVSISTVMLSSLSKLYAAKNFDKAKIVYAESIKFAFIIAMPAAFGLIFISDLLIEILYQRGNFYIEDTIRVAKLLQLFSLGLPAFILNKVMVQRYFARKRTKRVLIVSIITVVTNTSLCYLLVKLFQEIAIPISLSISTWIGIIMLSSFKITVKDIAMVTKTIISCIFMAASMYIVSKYCNYASIVKLILYIIVGIISYILSAISVRLVSIKEIKYMIQSL